MSAIAANVTDNSDLSVTESKGGRRGPPPPIPSRLNDVRTEASIETSQDMLPLSSAQLGDSNSQHKPTPPAVPSRSFDIKNDDISSVQSNSHDASENKVQEEKQPPIAPPRKAPTTETVESRLPPTAEAAELRLPLAAPTVEPRLPPDIPQRVKQPPSIPKRVSINNAAGAAAVREPPAIPERRDIPPDLNASS